MRGRGKLPDYGAYRQNSRRLQSRGSVRGNREVYSDASLGFDGVSAQVVRFEMPLLHRFLSGAGEDGRSAEHAEILDQAIAADERLEYDRALDFHLARQQRIAGILRPADDFGGIPGNLHPFAGGADYAGRSVAGADGRGSLGCWLCRRARLEIDAHGVGAGVNRVMNISGDDFDFERRQDG